MLRTTLFVCIYIYLTLAFSNSLPFLDQLNFNLVCYINTLLFLQAYNKRLLNGWEALRSVRKPIIAAVNGYALGGGCELALMCDIVIAADTAALGQPEITLGVIPGMGGTQRLTRAIGKSRAMEMILTGARVGAVEAARIGLVSRAVPAAELMQEVRHVAKKIAQYSMPAVAKAKECVNAAFEGSLAGKSLGQV